MKRRIFTICFIIVILLIVLGFFMFKTNNQEIDMVKVSELKEKSEFKSNSEYSDSNTQILKQLNDESFWKEKNETIIKKKLDGIYEFDPNNIDIVGYGLECDEDETDLSKCAYDVGFIYRHKVSSRFNNGVGYESFGDNGHCGGGYFSLTYSCIAKYIAMNDIGLGKVFYKAGNDYAYRGDKYDMLNKYMGNYYEYSGDIRDVHFVQYVVSEEGVANYYKYIINDDGEILFKDIVKFITRDEVKQIIADDASINPDNIKYLKLNAEEEIYTSNFSYNGHTYEYKIDAKNGLIINGLDSTDIGREKALEIAMKDSGVKSSDLWKDVDHGHGEMKMLLSPDVNKEGTGKNAIYKVEIETKNYKLYTYQIKAIDGQILSKRFSEYCVISDRKIENGNLTYKIESLYPKKKKIEINLSKINMDDIYEFKDSIYLRVTFDGNDIIDWDIIDRPYDNIGKMTSDELDEYYDFDSHHIVKNIDLSESGIHTINFSDMSENVIYKYTILTSGRNYGFNIINDTEKDIIVYLSNAIGKYKPIPYLKNGYGRYRDRVGSNTKKISLMYKEASSGDLFKIIDKEEITFLSKYNVGDQLERGYDENYIYNDTDNDLTISVTDYGIIDAPEDLEFIVKPGEFADCYQYTDIVKIVR